MTQVEQDVLRCPDCGQVLVQVKGFLGYPRWKCPGPHEEPERESGLPKRFHGDEYRYLMDAYGLREKDFH
jgi:hypothetical protein